MCNLCQVGIIRVVMMSCAKCKLKGLITSQTPLNWWGRPPKQMKNKKTRKQRLVKVIVCPCKHLGVIKFLAIHLNTMEDYTLWWNGSMLQKMLDYNTKYLPILNNQMFLWQKGLDMERWIQLVTFRQNYVKLT